MSKDASPPICIRISDTSVSATHHIHRLDFQKSPGSCFSYCLALICRGLAARRYIVFPYPPFSRLFLRSIVVSCGVDLYVVTLLLCIFVQSSNIIKSSSFKNIYCRKRISALLALSLLDRVAACFTIHIQFPCRRIYILNAFELMMLTCTHQQHATLWHAVS